MSKRKAFVDFVKAENLFFLLAVTLLALAVRLRFFPFASGDYHQFLQGWFSELRNNGGFAAVGRSVGDYTPTYLYLLAFLSYLPAPDLYLIKLLSFAGDIVLAFFARRIVQLKYEEFWGEIAYGVVILLPSVVLNSAAWGQCDSIYTAALLACVYYVLTDRQCAAVTAFSVAFAFKLQAVFLAPFLLVLVVRRKIAWRTLLIIPAVYVAAMLPAALLGRDLGDLLTVYFRQARQYSDISMYLPNLAVWYPKGTPASTGMAIAFAAAAVAMLAAVYIGMREFDLTDEMIVSLALLSVLFVPYVLPYMHERYFYCADVLGVVYAFYFPEKFYVPVLTVLSSTYVVCHNLFHAHFINIKVLSVLILFCLLWVGVSTMYLTRDRKIEHIAREKMHRAREKWKN